MRFEIERMANLRRNVFMCDARRCELDDCCAYDSVAIICIGKIDFLFVGTHTHANPRLVLFRVAVLYCTSGACTKGILYFWPPSSVGTTDNRFWVVFCCAQVGNAARKERNGSKWNFKLHFPWQFWITKSRFGGCLALRVLSRAYNCLWCCRANTSFLQIKSSVEACTGMTA